MTTAWNPADKDAAITLTSTNHVASSVSGGNNGVRSTGVTHSSGKWYMEYTDILSPGGSGAYGFAALADTLGAAGQLGVGVSGTFFGAGGSVAVGSAPDGKTVAFAVDLDNLKAWIRYDAGSWVGNGVGSPDPSTNTGGLDITGSTLPLYLHAWLQNNPGHVTVNAGDSAFVQAIPSGFLAWDAPIPNPEEYFGVVIS